MQPYHLTAGNADLGRCHLSEQQPIQLDPDRRDRLVVETDGLRPYASRALLDRANRRRSVLRLWSRLGAT